MRPGDTVPSTIAPLSTQLPSMPPELCVAAVHSHYPEHGPDTRPVRERQEGVHGSTAHVLLLEDGSVAVLSIDHRPGRGGPEVSGAGSAAVRTAVRGRRGPPGRESFCRGAAAQSSGVGEPFGACGAGKRHGSRRATACWRAAPSQPSAMNMHDHAPVTVSAMSRPVRNTSATAPTATPTKPSFGEWREPHCGA